MLLFYYQIISIVCGRCDYIHYNPVRHGLCSKAQDWQFSSIHRFIARGLYLPDWGVAEIPEKPQGIWDE
jgi:putative transposase